MMFARIVLIVGLALVMSGCDVVRYAAKCSTIAQRNCN